MVLEPGTRFGSYVVAESIGSGGMGEVYLARDTNLKRDVALKVLPPAFVEDADRLARFQREAEILASLNHPNIAQIYGLERSDGQTAIAMELVEGPTLADRIADGRIPPDEAMGIALQIVAALEAAHAKQIVHRDLKPANIKVREDGTVKVLDFGISKPIEPAAISGGSLVATTPAVTQTGVILGTAAYMSPEQARGKFVDQRTDVWAFGCLLFEMLTGQPAFPGEDVMAILARVIDRDTDFSSMPGTISAAVRHTIKLCLEKDPRKRIADIRDVRLALEGAFETRVQVARSPRSVAQRYAAIAIIAVAFVVGAAAALLLRPTPGNTSADSPAGPSGPMTNTTIELPQGADVALGYDRPLHGFDSPAVAVSSDGTKIAYVGESENGKSLYLRDLAIGNVNALPGTDDVLHAVFSPDARSLAFLTEVQLKRIELDSGSVSVLANTNTPVQVWWLEDGMIYFSEDQGRLLSRVPADGSSRDEHVAQVQWRERFARFTDVLPGGRAALLFRPENSISGDYADISLLDFDTLEETMVLRNGYGARYVEPGNLLFGRRGNLMAVRFDPNRRIVTGEEALVANNVGMESLFGIVHASASSNGVLAYAGGGDLTVGRLAWIDRQGTVEFIDDVPAQTYGVVDLSPDGTRIAVEVADVMDYIWIYDSVRREGRRLSAGESFGQPRWRPPEGRELRVDAVESERILLRDVDGGVGVTEIPHPAGSGDIWSAQSWMSDGNILAYAILGEPTTYGFLSIDGDFRTIDLEQAWINGFSPDGRYFAYTNQIDRYEIWVASYPDATERQTVSDSGIETVWCPCGELFYRDGNRWYSTRVTTEPELDFDPPTLAFETDFIDTPGISYAVTPDGQRLLVVKRDAQDDFTQLRVVTNWLQVLADGAL